MGVVFDNPKARAAKAWVDDRVTFLRDWFQSDPSLNNFSAELAILERIANFRFHDYPDQTAPWHLLQWPSMNWNHVHDVVSVIEALRQVKGAKAGDPVVLEPFQVLILLCFLGPHNDDGNRLIRTGLLTIGRKNAKTTLMSALVTALMALDPAHGGLYRQEIFVAASDREQAGEVFDAVNGFVTQDQELGLYTQFRCVPSTKVVTHTTTLTRLKVLSSEAYRAHGRNPRFVLFDEIGNLPATGAREFYSVLTTGFGAQVEPLILLLSTQAPTDAHIFSEMVDRCKRINDGSESGITTAGFVFETPEKIGTKEVDPFDEEYWHLGNPGLGTILRVDDLREQAKEARALPSLQGAFRNLRLNQRANPYSPLINKAAWDRCDGETFSVDELYGRPCTMGLDLATITDLAALVLVFEASEPGGQRPVVPYFWMPGEGIAEKARKDRVPYDLWAQQGLIDASSGKTINFSLIAETIAQCIADFDVRGLGYDRWRIKDLIAKLREIGLDSLVDDVEDGTWFHAIGQGFKDASPCVEALERAVLEETLAHNGNPILTWNAANATTERDPAGNRKFSKSKSYGRIDGIVALGMALRVVELMAQGEQEFESSFASDDCLM